MKISEELYGLSVCGGESKRMGTDKSFLTYFEKEQCYHVADLLHSDGNDLCKKVFISCNQVQADTISKEYNVLQDLPKYENTGPMAALLTAFNYYPDQDFLVAGCDYPFITSAILRSFLEQIKGNSIAAAFYNSDNKYEPLLAWYSKESGPILKRSFENKEYSLQHFLIKNSAEKYIPADHKVMTSVDTPDEFHAVKLLLDN